MKKVILFFLGMLFIYACGYQEGIVQKAEKSFIRFSGNLENVTIQIDDMTPFTLKSIADSEKNTTDDKKLYQVSPGRHSVKVYRGGNIIVNRILFIDNHATTEVIIP